MNQSDQINELVTALAKAQGEISPAIKDSNNPYFKSKYADLASVWSACKDSLSRNKLAIIQTMGMIDGQFTMITTLAHASGQWIRSYVPIVTEKNNAQAIGSAITYMRRYALSAIVGITSDDDDGNASMIMPEKKEKIVELPHREDIDANKLNEFITATSMQTKKSVNEIKIRALQNIDGFYDTFRKWEMKKVPKIMPIEDEDELA